MRGSLILSGTARGGGMTQAPHRHGNPAGIGTRTGGNVNPGTVGRPIGGQAFSGATVGQRWGKVARILTYSLIISAPLRILFGGQEMGGAKPHRPRQKHGGKPAKTIQIDMSGYMCCYSNHSSNHSSNEYRQFIYFVST